MENSITYPIRRFGIAGAVFVMCGAILFWELATGLQLAGGFAWDEPIMLFLASLHNPELDHVFYWITKTGDVLLFIPVLAMFIYLWRRSEKITAVILLVSVAIGPSLSLLLKNRFGRARPEVFTPLVLEHTASFPSGHTLTAVMAYGLISILLWQRGKRVLSIISGIWVFLVALSRVYLGAHYPSDVLASLALGTMLLIIILFVDKQLNARYDVKKDGTPQDS